MAYVVKVKLANVEKELAEKRPGYRLVAVHAHRLPDPNFWEASSDPETHAAMQRRRPMVEMRELYFEEEPEAPDINTMFNFDRHGNLCIVEQGR